MSEPRQLVLDLPHRPALGSEDFLVSAANEIAVGLIERWPDWPHPALLVVGPPRSGKSHLANVWRARSGAPTALAAAAIDDSAVHLVGGGGALVIEDIDRGIGNERVLFHLLNLAREHGGSLLLTSGRPAGELEIALPDLRSRLRALPQALIDEPDPMLLKAVLVKLFADRQLAVEPPVIEHLALHMERSFAAATRLVEEIDRRALAARRRVTRALATEVLAGMGVEGAGGAEDATTAG